MLPKSFVYKMLTGSQQSVSKKKTRLNYWTNYKILPDTVKRWNMEHSIKNYCVNEIYYRFQCIFYDTMKLAFL
jgi:hypothetical protein